MQRPIVGILGGMGPAATADLYAKIIAATPATRDQDHLHVVIWADPTAPDRSHALMHGGEDPTPWLLRGATQLVAMGASFIAVPCNTAHAFFPAIEREITVPLIHMMDETATAVGIAHPAIERAGLLATTGTIMSRLYQQWFANHGIEVVVPKNDLQERVVMGAIHRVKAGQIGQDTTDLLAEAARYLIDQGAEALIAGCTELPLVFRDGDASVPVIDPTRVLAEAVVRRARVATGGRRPMTFNPRQRMTAESPLEPFLDAFALRSGRDGISSRSSSATTIRICAKCARRCKWCARRARSQAANAGFNIRGGSWIHSRAWRCSIGAVGKYRGIARCPLRK
ncbi:MAG: amino acid racemase [Thermomicrobia bacterium]|nr:amino acid racemase [Thermomicrobia bacterium]